jgi:hypothetical protein
MSLKYDRSQRDDAQREEDQAISAELQGSATALFRYGRAAEKWEEVAELLEDASRPLDPSTSTDPLEAISAWAKAGVDFARAGQLAGNTRESRQFFMRALAAYKRADALLSARR